MPRKKIQNRVKKIIINIGDDKAVFDLDPNEEFEKPKKIREQMILSLKLKIKNQYPVNKCYNKVSPNPQYCIQKQNILFKELDRSDNIMNFQPILHQTKTEENNNISELPLSISSVLDEISSEEWMNLFF